MPLPANAADVKIWGRALQSYPGAVGSGVPFPEAQLAGDLYGAIPLNRAGLLVIWETLGLEKGNPGSAWHRIADYDEYALCMRPQRHKLGFFFMSTWYCEFGFHFGKADLEVRDIYLTASAELVGLFEHADMLLRGDRPLRAMPPKL